MAGPEHWVMRGVRGEEWLVTTQHLQVAFQPVDDPAPAAEPSTPR